jgi:7-carboxy-7-deazaguanine synthase
VILSPVYGELDPADLGGWILADNLPVRLGLQIQKYIWGPEARGV